jgi:YYY domain-containing protein
MTPRMRLQQEQGGTWSALFNRDAVQNAAPLAGALLWVLMLSVIGWIAFPLVYVVLPALRYRGYGMSRMLGLLIWGYVAWLLASLQVLPHTRAGLWLVLFALAAVSAWVGYRNRDGLRALLTEHWRSLVTIDLIFIGLYLVWVAYRGMNPDLWHPAMGGEKPMDFAYLNAVVKSTWFPPYDPWFAGGTLNYYYFGFVLVGSLVKLLGIVPSIAYNLAIPTLFALTGLGAYTLADTLAGGGARRGFRAGIWAVIFVLIIGNLGEAHMLYHGFVTVGGVDFESLIPGYPQLVSAVVGFWRVVGEGVRLPFRSEWWYWNATRIIPVLPGEVGPINEFPAFTFIYADLHAHAMALPLTQAALAFALQWGLGAAGRITEANPEKRWDRARGWVRAALPTPIASLLVGGLVAGSLRATNTWDYPTYLILMTVAFFTGSLVREFRTESRPPGQIGRLLVGMLTPVLLLVVAELLFRPFSAAYQGAYAEFEAWEGSRTPGSIYLLMYGMFLFPIVVVGLGRLITSAARYKRAVAETLDAVLWPIAVLLTLSVALVLLVGYYRVSIAWIAVPLGGLALLLLTAADTALLRRILWFWTGSALALSLLVEVLVLKGDIGRMNTVFKFHLQVWMLLALTAAVFFERLIHGSGGLLARIAPDDPPAGADPLAGQDADAANLSVPTLAEAEALPEQGGGPDAHFVQAPAEVEGETPEDVTLSQAEAPAGAESRAHQGPPAEVAEVFKLTVLGAAGALIFLAALYPLFAIPGRIRDRWVPSAPQTLDGMTYMLYATHYERDTAIPLTADYEIIRWLQDNVEGSPTIIEAQADREYLWGNRISVYTGLPSVVGWRWHQVQQRMVMPSDTVETRQRHIRSFYNTRNPEQAREILERYHVRYVILAPYERAYIEPEGLPKFEVMVEWGWLEVVYHSDTSTIFRVVD